MSLSRRTAQSLFLPPPSPAASRPPSPPQQQNRKGRLRLGTKLADAFGPSASDPFSPLPKFSSFDSGYAVQEYIAALVRRDPHDVELITAIPTSRQDAEEEEEEEEDEVELVDEDVWVFEQLRRLALDQHLWLAALSTPPSPDSLAPCSASSCPEMRASDWLFLCAAHSTPPSPPCSAVEYMLHSSDGAQALLNSSRYFPSRLAVGEGGRRLLDAVARRLYRSFAHAFYHHPPLFASLELETSLVRRFCALNRRFGMVDEGGMIIPEDALVGEGEGEGEGGWDEEGDGEEDEREEEGGIRAVQGREDEE
ncbi:hypothetical protein JCM10213_004216 [Rhodosporidiobolus nylandii]